MMMIMIMLMMTLMFARHKPPPMQFFDARDSSADYNLVSEFKR